MPSTTLNKQNSINNSVSIRNITVTALMSAAATVLMFVSFGLPILPSYLKVDFSELPALLTSFALGPVYGVIVCLVKNLFNVAATTTGGVGELCNFLLGALFVAPAGIIYRRHRTRSTALIGTLVGVLTMTGVQLLCEQLPRVPGLSADHAGAGDRRYVLRSCAVGR